MPLVRKRRATQAEPPNDDDASSASEAPPSTNNRRRRTNNNSPDESDASDDAGAADYNDSGIQAPDGTDAMVKDMVRLALACEYSRQPIRRKEISTKVLGDQGSRQFKTVFEQAQKELRYRFGMEMTEQPAKANLGMMSQGRATQRQTQQPPSASNKSWLLTTTLPPTYRTPTILPPPRAPSSSTEATYVGLYTFIISVITLSGGSIPEQKLERYLRRVNADTYTPLDRTELLLARLVKEGYLIKNRDTEGGEEVVEYLVGARGRVEVGDAGVAGLARMVYGFEQEQEQGQEGNQNNGDGSGAGTEREEFEAKLKRSLGLKEMGVRKDESAAGAAGGQEGGGRGRGRGRVSTRERRRADGDDDDEDMEYGE